jgi:hypothetical protein
MGPLEAAVLRYVVVPHGNDDESENLVLRSCDKRPRERRSLDLFSDCILLTQLSVVPQGQMCGESGRGTQTRLSIPSEFTSSRENPVQLRATTSFVTRAVKLVRSIPTQVLQVLNLATRREEVCRCASSSMHYENEDWMKDFRFLPLCHR